MSRSIACVIVIAATFAYPGCSEALPPREEPGNVVDLKLSATPDNFKASRISFRLSDSSDTSYWLMPASMYIIITLTNRYNEVLQDSARLGGSVDLWDINRPRMRATIPLQNPTVLQSQALSNGWLTLEPGVPVQLRYKWDHMTTVPPSDSVMPIWIGADTNAVVDSTTNSHAVDAGPLVMTATGSFQPFVTLGPIVVPAVQFLVRYRLYYSMIH